MWVGLSGGRGRCGSHPRAPADRHLTRSLHVCLPSLLPRVMRRLEGRQRVPKLRHPPAPLSYHLVCVEKFTLLDLLPPLPTRDAVPRPALECFRRTLALLCHSPKSHTTNTANLSMERKRNESIHNSSDCIARFIPPALGRGASSAACSACGTHAQARPATWFGPASAAAGSRRPTPRVALERAGPAIRHCPLAG